MAKQEALEPKKVLLNNQAVELSKVKTVVDFSAPQPAWAKYFFLITLLLSTITIGYLAATDLVSEKTKLEVSNFINLVIIPLVWGLSKMFGIDLKDKK